MHTFTVCVLTFMALVQVVPILKPDEHWAWRLFSLVIFLSITLALLNVMGIL